MVQKFEFNKAKIPGLIEITPFNADDIRKKFLNKMESIMIWRKYFTRLAIRV